MYDEFMKYLKSYKTGEALTFEGDENDDFFCLLQGSVGIWKNSSEDTDESYLIGEIQEKGHYFGEMSALIKEPRTATIKALAPVKVLRFPGTMLPQMILKQPKLGLKLATSLAERLKGTTNKQQDLTSKKNELQQDATQQLASARETFDQFFILISAIQMQYQFQPLKAVIQLMSQTKLFRRGKGNDKLSEEFKSSLPPDLLDVVKKFQEARDKANAGS